MREFICSECGLEYDPMVKEDDCGVCEECVDKLYKDDLEYEFYGTVLA